MIGFQSGQRWKTSWQVLPWGPRHLSEVMLSISSPPGLPGQAKGRRGTKRGGTQGPWPGRWHGPCVTAAGLWQGAEEVLQQH